MEFEKSSRNGSYAGRLEKVKRNRGYHMYDVSELYDGISVNLLPSKRGKCQSFREILSVLE